MPNLTDILSNIARDPKLFESDDEDSKNASSDDELIMYARRDSEQSNSSSQSTVSRKSSSSEPPNSEDTKTVEELSDKLKNTLEVDADAKNVESLTEKLKANLKVADDDDLVERSPMKHDYLGPSRHYTHPYPQQAYRTVNHYSGGTVVQPNETVYNDYYSLPELDPVEVSDFLNSYSPTSPEQPSIDFSILQELTSNFSTPQSSVFSQSSTPSFSLRQASPARSSSPDRSSAYSSDVLSPQSCTSVETDSSQPVGSPYSGYDLPTASGMTLAGSPARAEDLPKTLPNSSDDETKKKEAITDLRQLIELKYMDIKKYEWIRACQKDKVEELFSDLRKLLTESRLTDRRLVRIYATIAIILKRDGHLRHFFLLQPQILSTVAMKNHPLLMRYIIETMQNLGLAPESIENPTVVLKKIIEHNQNMTEMLQTLLSMRNEHNVPMFDVNQPDDEGFTAVHYILQKISMENPEGRRLALNYLKMSLETQPDCTLRTAVDNRTYLHHSVLWGCGADTTKLILQYAQRGDRLLNFNLVNEVDINGDSALKMAASLVQGRKEVEEVLLQYDAFNIYPQIDPAYQDFDPLSEFLNNS